MKPGVRSNEASHTVDYYDNKFKLDGLSVRVTINLGAKRVRFGCHSIHFEAIRHLAEIVEKHSTSWDEIVVQP